MPNGRRRSRSARGPCSGRDRFYRYADPGACVQNRAWTFLTARRGSPSAQRRLPGCADALAGYSRTDADSTRGRRPDRADRAFGRPRRGERDTRPALCGTWSLCPVRPAVLAGFVNEMAQNDMATRRRCPYDERLTGRPSVRHDNENESGDDRCAPGPRCSPARALCGSALARCAAACIHAHPAGVQGVFPISE